MRVISSRRARSTPEFYDATSYYQLIVSITKCEKLSLGIFIIVREGFQSIRIKVTGPVSFIHFSFLSCYFFIDFDWLSCALWLIFIGLNGIYYLIFIGSLTLQFVLSDYKLLLTTAYGYIFGVTIAKLSYKYGLLRTNQIQEFCY